MTILIFILIISFLVFIHELGHYLVARRHGVRVKEFGIGYPPRIKRLFTWKGTAFTINAIPFGGFVKLEGEDYDPQNPPDKPSPTAFYAKPPKSRIAIMVAGSLANILFGMAAFSMVFGVLGIPRFLEGRPRIEQVAPGSPAAEAGLTADQEILGFRLREEFVETPLIDDVVEFVDLNRGETVTVVTTGACQGYECPEIAHEAELTLRTESETPAGEGSMGVVFSDFFLEKGPWATRIWQGIVYGVREALALGVLIVVAVVDLFKQIFTAGTVPAGVAGPVGIVHQASQTSLLSRGWAPLLEFSGMLSINLGVMNLLPIPALDGGRVLFVMLEKIFGRKRIQAIEGYVHYGGFLLLLGLIILISFKDIWQIFQS